MPVVAPPRYPSWTPTGARGVVSSIIQTSSASGGGSSSNFRPYTGTFQGSTHLCLTLGPRSDYYNGDDDDDTITFRDVAATLPPVTANIRARQEHPNSYNVPCTLQGLSWTDFETTTTHCPPFQHYGFPHAERISEFYYNSGRPFKCVSLVSVVYAECPPLSIAFGSAVALVTYVQIFPAPGLLYWIPWFIILLQSLSSCC
jgi:hypothetical protein